MMCLAKSVIKFFRNRELYEQLKLLDNEKSALLFGSPLYWNEGDQAIAVAEHKLWDQYIKNRELIDIPKELWEQKKNIICDNSIGDRPIFFTGGGYIGDIWGEEQAFVEDVLKHFQCNPIVFFPQTVFFKEEAFFRRFINVINDNKNVLFCARDSKTYKKMKSFENENIRIMFVPDMVLSMREYQDNTRNNKVLVCLREDLEGIQDREFGEKIRKVITQNKSKYFDYTTAQSKYVRLKKREHCYSKAVSSFKKSKCVITDRLHGMILAAITGTPVLFYDNLSHKVSLTYEWIKDLEYVMNGEQFINIEEGVKSCLAKADKSKYSYSTESIDTIYSFLFDKIMEVIDKT